MTNRKIGYCRVSIDDQSLDLQRDAFVRVLNKVDWVRLAASTTCQKERDNGCRKQLAPHNFSPSPANSDRVITAVHDLSEGGP